MKNILIAIIICISSNIYGQNSESESNGTCSKGEQIAKFIDTKSKQMFENDVQKKSVRLYLLGGLVSVLRENDKPFQEKYKITYHDFGCVVPANLDLYIAYNQLVFASLEQNFKDDWKKEVNKNTLGFRK